MISSRALHMMNPAAWRHSQMPLNLSLGALSATAVPADLVSKYNEVMDRTAKPVLDGIKRLRSATDGYSVVKLVTLGPVLGTVLQAPEETRRAIHSALNTLDTRMQQLTAGRADVLAGALPIDKWISAVNAVLAGVHVQAKDLNEGTILNAIAVQANEAAQSYKQLLSQLAKLPESIGTGLKWGIPIAVGAAGILAILIVPRLIGGTTVVVGSGGTRGLGGLRRRRKRTGRTENGDWRYIPKTLFSRGGPRAVVEVKAFPPGQHSGAPVRSDMTAVRATLDNGQTRWFGVEEAKITSGLRMAVRGGFVNPRNELVKDWKKARLP